MHIHFDFVSVLRHSTLNKTFRYPSDTQKLSSQKCVSSPVTNRCYMYFEKETSLFSLALTRTACEFLAYHSVHGAHQKNA